MRREIRPKNLIPYAVLPHRLRLVIDDHGTISIYDSGRHRISGVVLAQSSERALTFTSQDGLVRVSDLPKVRGKKRALGHLGGAKD